MPQSFASLHCHVVFSTKHREPFIEPEWQPRLYKIIGGILRNDSSSLIAAGGTADHVHLLASLGRTISVADAVRDIKANSSGWVHNELGLADFQWQQGYGAFAVSYSQIDSVKAYLANQEQHHARQSFQDEFRKILQRHEIEWEERYVWD
jgi:REP element-mobilizing transposase RayT